MKIMPVDYQWTSSSSNTMRHWHTCMPISCNLSLHGVQHERAPAAIACIVLLAHGMITTDA